MRGENRSTRRKTSRSRVENQQTQPTYDANSGNRTRATLVGGERSTTAPTLLPFQQRVLTMKSGEDNGEAGRFNGVEGTSVINGHKCNKVTSVIKIGHKCNKVTSVIKIGHKCNKVTSVIWFGHWQM